MLFPRDQKHSGSTVRTVAKFRDLNEAILNLVLTVFFLIKSTPGVHPKTFCFDDAEGRF